MSGKRVKAPPRSLRITFFVLCALAATAALYLGLANTDTGDPEPGWALESPALHRLAVIVALFLCVYAVIVVLYLAAQGRSFTELRRPGGTGVAEPETLEEGRRRSTTSRRLGRASRRRSPIMRIGCARSRDSAPAA